MISVERIVAVATTLGWGVKLSEQSNSCNTVDKIASFYKMSPAGEDFGFDVFYTDADDLIRNIKEYAANFDVDEHIEMWIEARNNGVAGVPTTRELVEDAENICAMLSTLNEAEQNAAKVTCPIQEAYNILLNAFEGKYENLGESDSEKYATLLEYVEEALGFIGQALDEDSNI